MRAATVKLIHDDLLLKMNELFPWMAAQQLVRSVIFRGGGAPFDGSVEYPSSAKQSTHECKQTPPSNLGESRDVDVNWKDEI